MAFTKKADGIAVVHPANMVRIVIRVKNMPGSKLVQNAFSNKGGIMDAMATPKANKGTRNNRPVRDYNKEFQDAQHVSTEGWCGIPCQAFRAAMIAACRTIGLVMTTAKLSLTVIADGVDRRDGDGLVRIISETGPTRLDKEARNSNGSVDIRVRPMWREWEADVTVEFDADMISTESVVNLLDRAGRQVGVQEGRNFSKNSVGQGWGAFTVVTDAGNATEAKTHAA